MKATNPKIIALLLGIVAIGTVSLYLVKSLTDYSARASVEKLLSDGRALMDKGDYKSAAAKLEECRRKAVQQDMMKLANQSLLLLSRCYTAEGEREKTIESWKKVVETKEMANHHAEAFYTVGRLRAAGESPEQHKEAEESYKRAVSVGAGSRFADLAEVEIATMMMDRGELLRAKETLDKLKAREAEYPELKKAGFRLNMKLLFSPVITKVPQSEYYVVKEGDTLDGIGKKFGTTADLLAESNKVDPRRLQIGKRLKVVTGKFRVRVSKSKNILQLLTEDVVLNEYRIGTGKHSSTPTGKFAIAEKTPEPAWFRRSDGRVIPYGHPENVLGTRWMKLQSIDGQDDLSGYGIHGTDDESSIGKESSEGCIRLLNRDVEELYKIVPVGTQVVVEE